MIVTTADFVGENAIAQVEQPNVAAEVNLFIDKYEPEYLHKVLGLALFDAYTAGIIAEDPIYIALRDGGTYISYAELRRYEGLKPGIINYVYYHYIRNHVTYTTGTGEKAINNPVDSTHKQVRAWNDMVEHNRGLYWYALGNSLPITRSTDLYHYINPLGI